MYLKLDLAGSLGDKDLKVGGIIYTFEIHFCQNLRKVVF